MEWAVGTEKHTAVSVPLKIANYVFPVVGVRLKPSDGSNPISGSFFDALADGPIKEIFKDPEFYNVNFDVSVLDAQFRTLHEISNLAFDLPKKFGGYPISVVKTQNLPLEQLASVVYYNNPVEVKISDVFPQDPNLLPPIITDDIIDRRTALEKILTTYGHFNAVIDAGRIKMNADKKDVLVEFSPQILFGLKNMRIGGKDFGGITTFSVKGVIIVTGNFPIELRNPDGTTQKIKYLNPSRESTFVAHELAHNMVRACDIYTLDQYTKQKNNGCIGDFPEQCLWKYTNYGSPDSCFGEIIGSSVIGGLKTNIYDVMGAPLSGMAVGYTSDIPEPLLWKGFPPVDPDLSNPHIGTGLEYRGAVVSSEVFITPEVELVFLDLIPTNTINDYVIIKDAAGNFVDTVKEGEKIFCETMVTYDYYTPYKNTDPRFDSKATLLFKQNGQTITQDKNMDCQITTTIYGEESNPKTARCKAEFTAPQTDDSLLSCFVETSFTARDVVSKPELKLKTVHTTR